MIEPTDSRSETRARIVDVAARLLHEHGPSAVTTRGVAEAAGVQAPAIYRLFGDKDGLLDAVAEHVLATYVSGKAATVRAASENGVDPVDDLWAGWRTQIDFGISNPMLFAIMADPVRGMRSPAALSAQGILDARVHRIALTGRLRVSEQRAVDLIRAVGTGAVHTLLSTPAERRDLTLADDLFDAVLRRIVTDAPDVEGQGVSPASAVTLRAGVADLEMLSAAERQLLGEWLDRIIDVRQRDAPADPSQT